MFPEPRTILTFLAVVALLAVGWLGVKGMLADREANSVVMTVANPTTCTTLTVRVPVSQQEQLSDPYVLEDYVLAHPDAVLDETLSLFC